MREIGWGRGEGDQAKHRGSSSISHPIKDQLKVTTAIGSAPYQGNRRCDLKGFFWRGRAEL